MKFIFYQKITTKLLSKIPEITPGENLHMNHGVEPETAWVYLLDLETCHGVP